MFLKFTKLMDSKHPKNAVRWRKIFFVASVLNNLFQKIILINKQYESVTWHSLSWKVLQHLSFKNKNKVKNAEFSFQVQGWRMISLAPPSISFPKKCSIIVNVVKSGDTLPTHFYSWIINNVYLKEIEREINLTSAISQKKGSKMNTCFIIQDRKTARKYVGKTTIYQKSGRFNFQTKKSCSR